jgi:hypothetical protein
LTSALLSSCEIWRRSSGDAFSMGAFSRCDLLRVRARARAEATARGKDRIRVRVRAKGRVGVRVRVRRAYLLVNLPLIWSR